jgi:hypothetical protein
MGPPAPHGRRYGGDRPGAGEWYGGRPQDVPPPPPWTTRPTGTVPWADRSGGGRNDFFAGMGGTSRGGRSPSGTDIIRALVEAFRRSRGTR